MKPRLLLALLAVGACLLFAATGTAEAGRYRRARVQAPRPQPVRCVVVRRTAPQAYYPRMRRTDGKTLWDLGKQNGQWPSLP